MANSSGGSMVKAAVAGYGRVVMQPNELRVALFSGNYNYVRDGANQALNLLVRHLLDAGAAVRVYSPATDTPAFAATGDLVRVPALSVPGGRGEYKVAKGMPARTRRDLEAFAPTVVHVSAPDLLGHRAVSWARARGIPALASVHTRFETYLRYYRLGFAEPVFRRLLTRFYNRVDRVMTPTPSITALIEGWGVTTPIDLWPRGVNHRRFSPAVRDPAWRASLGIGERDVAIGFLGRLVLEKGLDVFAETMRELDRRATPHKVVVIGEGPARGWFAGRVPAAIFAGFQAGDALGRAVASLDVLFNPSVTETWGQVTSEAMAAGVPVVAARATGAVDLVVDGVTGFLVPPRDVGAYADAIATLVGDDARRLAAGRAGHARAAGFRWDTANEAVLRAYLALVAERRALS